MFNKNLNINKVINTKTQRKVKWKTGAKKHNKKQIVTNAIISSDLKSTKHHFMTIYQHNYSFFFFSCYHWLISKSFHHPPLLRYQLHSVIRFLTIQSVWISTNHRRQSCIANRFPQITISCFRIPLLFDLFLHRIFKWFLIRIMSFFSLSITI